MNDEVLARIDALAAKLGVVGEHLWGVLVRQAYIEGAGALFGAVVFALVAGGVLRAAFRAKAAHNPNVKRYGEPVGPWKWEDHPEWLIGGGAVVAMAVFGGSLCAIHAATCLLNPEYAAISKLLP